MARHEQEVARQTEAIACSKLVQDMEVEENTAGSLGGLERREQQGRDGELRWTVGVHCGRVGHTELW